jgi:hypothetical protein
MKVNDLSRRNFLRGAGVVLALPLMESMASPALASVQKTGKPVKRFVCLSNNYGVYQKTFFPDVNQPGKKLRYARDPVVS